MSAPRVGPRRRTLALTGIAGLATLLGFPALTTLADPAATADTAWSPLPGGSETVPGNRRVQRGKEVFDQRCAACHGPIPTEIHGPTFLPPMPGTQGLTARYQGALPALLEERTDLTAERVRTVVREGFVSMPFYRPTELSNEDLDMLVAYLTRER